MPGKHVTVVTRLKRESVAALTVANLLEHLYFSTFLGQRFDGKIVTLLKMSLSVNFNPFFQIPNTEPFLTFSH